MVRTVKNMDPDGKIIFITTPAGKILLQNNELIDKIIIYNKRSADRGIRGLFKVVKEIRNAVGTEKSIFISPHRFIRASAIGLLIGSKLRIGFKNSMLFSLYTRTVPYMYGIHETERNRMLLSEVFPGLGREEKPAMPGLFPSKYNIERVAKIINDKFGANEKIIAIAPGSVWNTKRWPEEYYKKLIELFNNKGIKTILIGGSDDRKLCGRIASESSINLAGGLSLLESAAAVSLAAALVTNDSAPLHMASAMNVPAAAIFGSTTPYLGFGPLSAGSIVIENKSLDCRPCGRHGGVKCPKGHFDCMNKIYPETVYREVLKIIKN